MRAGSSDPAVTANFVVIGAVTGQWRGLLAAAGFLTGHQVGEALVPVVIGAAIGQAIGTGDLSALGWWLLVLGTLFAAFSVSFRWGDRIATRTEQRAAHELRVKVTDRILQTTGGSSAGRLPGELVNIAAADAMRVGQLNSEVAVAIAAVGAFTVCVVVVLQISPALGVVVIVGVLALLAATRLLGRALHRSSEAEQEHAARAAGLAGDLLVGLRVLNGLGAANAAAQRYRQASRSALTATLRAARAEAIFNGAAVLITGCFLAVVALVGGRMAASGDIGIGALIAVVGVAQFLIGPMDRLASVASGVARAHASAGRVAEVLRTQPPVTTGSLVPAGPVRGDLEFRGVSLGNLRALDLHVAAGEAVGIVALAVADAHHLLECLDLSAAPSSGAVLLDGMELSQLDSRHARAALLVAPHDAVLFTGSLRDNLAPNGAAPVDPALLDLAIAASGTDEIVASRPAGLDLHVGEQGAELSGGQRQRVALARALAADAPILVLHDPTTAVDSVTEAAIATGIGRIRSGQTTVLVTTSPALLAICDRILILQDGVIESVGTHHELTVAHEGYRRLVLS